MTNRQDFLNVSEQWIRILNKVEEHEKAPRNFGTGDLLHSAEIHTIMAIGKHPRVNVTRLSEILGISKSAISQMVGRLEKKSLVEKYRDADNEKTILLRLSPRGHIAYLGHEQHHARIYAMMHRNLGEISEDEMSLIVRFLTAIEATFDEYERMAG